ncbi:LysR family transcriptional regulator, partial [Desulfovibrio sp. 1214_IL3152]
MEMTDLRTLVSVMETGSITAAAKALNRVPSGVTMRILQLEESLGVQLFLREKKRLYPTDKAHTLHQYALRILALTEEAESRVRGMAPGGKFRIGALES